MGSGIMALRERRYRVPATPSLGAEQRRWQQPRPRRCCMAGSLAKGPDG